MRVLVYEHLTESGPDDGGSMYREGRAMRDALRADLAAIPGCELVESNADLAFVIAPETDGILEDRVAYFRRSYAVLAPRADALALTADKLRLAEHWTRHAIPTPSTVSARAVAFAPRPSVLKPRDGAGSCETYFLCEGEALPESLRNDRFLLQDFVPGLAASVAFLVGPDRTIPLPPCFQHLSDDGRFQYRGGSLPIPEPLARRAVAIGRRAIDVVPGLLGYVGVDLVLADAGDAAIEINPRLTTSYLGLRALCADNLAEWMIDCITGKRPVPPRWHSWPCEFGPDGIRTIRKK